MAWVATMAEEDIPFGACVEVPFGQETIMLVRTGQGVFACAAYCPHKAMHLATATLDGPKLTCPLHAATFDLRTGRPDDETDWAGELPVFETDVRDGVVHVREKPVRRSRRTA